MALPFAVIDCMVWAIWHYVTGSIPVTHEIHLIWWHWSLPFGISRLWDIVIIPALVVLAAVITVFFRDDDDGCADGIGTYIIIVSGISSVAALVFGITYWLIAFIVTLVVSFCGTLAIGLALSIYDWCYQERRRKEIAAELAKTPSKNG